MLHKRRRRTEGPIDTLINAVHSGDIDAIICARSNASRLEGLSVEDLVLDRMKLFVNVAHPLASEKEIDARRVLDFPIILPPGSSATRDALDNAFLEAAGRKPSGTVETSSYAVIKRLLLASQHISFRSVKEFREDFDAGVIKSLDLGFEFDDRAICILQRSSAIQTPATSKVINLIRCAARDAREFG